MSSAALYFASGESLYSGAVLLLLAIALFRHLDRGWLSHSRSVLAWVGVSFVVMASPPFSWIVDALFLAAFVVWLVTSKHADLHRLVHLRIVATAILGVLLVSLPAIEFTHRRMPEINGFPDDHLVIIGDSLSAGFGNSTQPWPTLMQRFTGVRIENLARPGALTVDGLGMADLVQQKDHAILIEIGGNDLLSGVPARIFGQHLEAIAAKLAAPYRTVVMFELPLLPNKIAFGQIQRRIAAKYGIWLIPKRFLAESICGENATSDGLHLSPLGAEHMAHVVAQAFSRILKS